MISKATKITPAVTPMMTETYRKVTSCASPRGTLRLEQLLFGAENQQATVLFVLPTICHRRRGPYKQSNAPGRRCGHNSEPSPDRGRTNGTTSPRAIVRYGKGYCRSLPCNYPACLFPDNSLPARHRYPEVKL